MAYNKNNYEHQNLTPKQEKFVDGILEGKTQYQAYIDAYPRAKTYKRKSIDELASNLMKNIKIKSRLQELGWKDKTEVMITRKNMIKRIEKVMQLHEEEMERIQQAYQADKQRVMEEISGWMKLLNQPNMDNKAVQSQINQLTQKLIQMEKQRTLNSVNTSGILKAADRINRMMGFDITKVEITTQDEEREEMEKLSADELRQLINISKKGE